MRKIFCIAAPFARITDLQRECALVNHHKNESDYLLK